MIQPSSPPSPSSWGDVHLAQKETPGLRAKSPVSVSDAPENLKVVVSRANHTGTEGHQRSQGFWVPHWGTDVRHSSRQEGSCALLSSSILPLLSLALENLESGASLRVLEGQSLRLLCVAHGNPPAQLSWTRLGRTVNPSHPSDPGVLELLQIQTEQEGEFTCWAQNPLGSQNISLSLSVVCEYGGPWGQEAGVPGRGEAPLIPPISPHSPPTAAGPLLLPGGRGSALQLLLPSPAGPLPALAARLGAAGGGAQQRLLRDKLQLRRALGQQFPEPPRGAQLWPQPQLRGPERPRGPERVCPAAARSGVCCRGRGLEGTGVILVKMIVVERGLGWRVERQGWGQRTVLQLAGG